VPRAGPAIKICDKSRNAAALHGILPITLRDFIITLTMVGESGMRVVAAGTIRLASH
jgi:hypothetical protein